MNPLKQRTPAGEPVREEKKIAIGGNIGAISPCCRKAFAHYAPFMSLSGARSAVFTACATCQGYAIQFQGKMVALSLPDAGAALMKFWA